MTALNKQAQAIISDIRLKRGSGDVYAPIIRWDEFEVITGALEDAEKRIEEGICRANREHHRGFMMACNHLKEHANIHYADAAEMEIAALRQRIAELEAREIKPAKGEVLVTVSGFTGCGKSAIAGEIEIAMNAIGVPVKWSNGDVEKRMTGADWLTAIEMYRPSVRIVEVNVPRAAGIGVKGE